MANTKQWCFCWLANKPKATGAEKGVLLKEAKWVPGDTISISFLDGDPAVQQRVKEAALPWMQHANLVFAFRDTSDTDIRISFQYAGSWSVLGTTCRQITDRTQPTMNYGWLTTDTPKEELERVVLHEFGHAIGLTHEHMSPAGGIHWDRDAVKIDLGGPPNNWDLETIERNMFQTFAAGETNFTALDPASIMMYPIPEYWTTDKFSVGLNAKLSAKDIAFVREEYP
jgi:serralysin